MADLDGTSGSIASVAVVLVGSAAAIPTIGHRDDGASGALTAAIDRYFDPAWYVALYPDLRRVAENDPSFSLRDHFALYGCNEGRSPSLFFDIDYTLHRLAKFDDADLKPADVFRHFARMPPAERFVPNRTFSPWAFRAMYGDRYPEVHEMSDYAVFELYLDHRGYAALSPNGVFSEESYRSRNPDVAQAIGQGELSSAFMHFVMYGHSDARVNLPGLHAPEPAAELRWILAGQTDIVPLVWWFDEVYYLSVYSDVHDLVRRTIVKSGLEHFLAVGYGESRMPSPHVFGLMPPERDPDPWRHFRALGPELASLGPIDIRDACKIRRYLDASGLASSRTAIANALWPFVAPPPLGGTFDARLYLATNIDVAATVGDAKEDAFTHWKKFGLQEHRVAPGANLFGNRSIAFNDMLNWNSGVNFFGPINSSSGLGSAARGYVASLRAAGVPIDVYDTSWQINRKLPADLVCAEDLAYSINFLCLNADQVLSFVTKYGSEILDRRANVGAWVWELSTPRPEWRSILSAFDLIVTPSQFCSDTFSLFTSRPVRTVPYVVDEAELMAARDAAGENYWNTVIAAEKQAGRKIVLFIMDASSYTERKGIDIYQELAARVAAARPGQFCFVLKTHSRDYSSSANPRHGDAVLVVDGVFSFPDLCQLKSLADLYVSPHRSEGFGLNIVESILLGVPVLCSDYAGCTDLLAKAEPSPVPVKLREIGRTMGPYAAEAIWGEPDIDDMEARMLAFFDGKFSRRRFTATRRNLAQSLSPVAVGTLLRSEMEKWCAFGAEHCPDRLEAFRLIGTRPHDECFNVGYVPEATRRSPDSPGLARLGEIAMSTVQPFFSIITPTFNSRPEWLHELYDDLLHQSHPSWEWCICDDGSTNPETLAVLENLRRRDVRIKVRFSDANRGIAAATNTAVSFSIGHYIVMIDHDDRVAPSLLAAYREATAGKAAGCVVYCDEDKIDLAGRRCETYFKPDWSPQHLTSCMYVLHCLCIRKSVFLDLGGYRSAYNGAQDHDFMLRAAARGIPIHHVDQLMYHWRMGPSSAAGGSADKVYAIEVGRRAVADHMSQRGISGSVENGLIPGTYRIRPSLPADKVVLNILTCCTPWRRPRDAVAAPHPGNHSTGNHSTGNHSAGNHSMANGIEPRSPGGRRWPNLSGTYVENFVRSIVAYAPQLDFEIRLVVDRHAEQTAMSLADIDPRVSILPFDRSGEHFNFSEKANFAARRCSADRIVLLNDDMETMDGEWLPALLEMLELPEVGVVGGKLLYADHTVQHCGMALGVQGPAAHLFHGIDNDTIGYNAFNAVIRNYSAVTAAMIAFRRSTFERVGGFDVGFPVDYNDVDFCLKATETGLYTVYTPFARLLHYESRSARRLAVDRLDKHRFSQRWAAHIGRDPFYNRNLSRDTSDCSVSGDFAG